MRTAIVSFLFLFQIGYALPVGNPAETTYLEPCFSDYCLSPDCFFGRFSYRFGYYGDFVYNLHLEVDNSQRDDVKGSTLTTNAAYLAVDYCHFLQLFGTLGASSITLETNAHSLFSIPFVTNGRADFITDTSF